MRDINVDSNSDATTSPEGGEPPWLQVRREPFEYGMLPVPSLLHHDGVTSLQLLRQKLLGNIVPPFNWPSNPAVEAESFSGKKRVGVAGISASLDISESHAVLVLDTLASVLPSGANADPLALAFAPDIDAVGADIDDLLLLLFIQIYRRLPPRAHKDPAAVADVWPSNSPFDGLLSTLSPVQVKPTKKTMPGQAEEETHQLAFVQKHLPALLSLLAESSEDETKVLTLEKFDRLELLFRPTDVHGNIVTMSQAAPFFANSDPDMPAAAVPLTQALDWVAQHLASSKHRTVKENGPMDRPLDSFHPEADVTMVDAYQPYIPNGLNRTKDWNFEGLTFVDGVSKSCTMKREADVPGDTVKVSNCHDAIVYVLAPLKYASVFGCSDSIVVLGAVGKAVKVEHCERVQLIVPCGRICISNCRECVFFLGVNQRPLILGNNYNLQVAPYNTFYPKLEAHLTQVRVDPTVNRWDKILTLGAADPHDSISHPAGTADAQAEGASLVPPDRFSTFSIPKSNGVDLEQSITRANPFLLPKLYLIAQQQRNKAMENLRQMLKNVPLDDVRKRDLANAIHAHFREWLYASGNIRQLYDLQPPERDHRGME